MNQVAKIEESRAVSVSDDTRAMMSMIEQIALNPEADVAKLRAVMDMKMEMFNRGAEIEYNAAMADAQREMEPVVRKAYNQQTKSKYAKLEDIIEKIGPIWTRHGFALSFGTGTCEREGFYRVECECTHSAGHSKHYHADLPTDMTGIAGTVNKTAIHGFGSTVSYGRRYLTCMIFNIAVKNEDDDGSGAGKVEYLAPKDIEAIRKALKVAGVEEKVLLKKGGVDSMELIDKRRYGGIMKWLQQEAQK